MIRVEDQQKVFLIKWLRKVCQQERNPKEETILAQKTIFKPLGGAAYFTQANIKSKELKHTIKSTFWKSVIGNWLEINQKMSLADREIDHTFESKLKMPIFNNVHIRYKNRPIFIIKWIERGVKYVHQMVTDGRIKSFEDMQENIEYYPGLEFDYLAVYNAISNVINTNGDNILQMNLLTETEDTESENAKLIFSLSKKEARQVVIKHKDISSCGISFWRRKLNVDITKYWETAFKATKESRLRLLHFKILHNIYPTQILLKKIGIKDTDKCDSCGERDFVEHSFYHCTGLKDFWRHVSNCILERTNINFKINETRALFGVRKEEIQGHENMLNEINHIMLIAKMCISKAKYGKVKNAKLLFETDLALREKLL